jgi:pyrroloquinoline-quinone synthase
MKGEWSVKKLLDNQTFFEVATSMINERRKMTSRLYQVVLEGQATLRLLQNFCIHRYPVKNLWTRHLMGVGGRIDDYELRRKFVENCYEEETGAFTRSDRHVATFIEFGLSLGLNEEEITQAPLLPETRELMDHNLDACNNTNVHLTEGATSVLLLMEGQPPIVNSAGQSMAAVMRDVYGLPKKSFEFFTHHASSGAEEQHVSLLEDEHTAAVAKVLDRYCTTETLRMNAIRSLEKSIELRHKHFDALYERFYDPAEPAFRFGEIAA